TIVSTCDSCTQTVLPLVHGRSVYERSIASHSPPTSSRISRVFFRRNTSRIGRWRTLSDWTVSIAERSSPGRLVEIFEPIVGTSSVADLFLRGLDLLDAELLEHVSEPAHHRGAVVGHAHEGAVVLRQREPLRPR